MTLVIGNISQKGGVGKSTLSRELSKQYSNAQWNVLIADLDNSQSTSFEWNIRRVKNDLKPFIAVQQFPNVDRVMKLKDNYDLIIFDGAPHATRATLQIANISDLVLLPTGSSKDDLDPQIRLAHELVKHGTPREKILFVLIRVGSSRIEIEETKDYINSVGYQVTGSIPEKTGYRRAMDEGKTLTETNFNSLNDRVDKVIQEIINKLENVQSYDSTLVHS